MVKNIVSDGLRTAKVSDHNNALIRQRKKKYRTKTMKINTKTVNSSEILVTALLRLRNRQTDRQTEKNFFVHQQNLI